MADQGVTVRMESKLHKSFLKSRAGRNLLLLAWGFGIVQAKGWFWKLIAFSFPLYAWYKTLMFILGELHGN